MENYQANPLIYGTTCDDTELSALDENNYANLDKSNVNSQVTTLKRKKAQFSKNEDAKIIELVQKHGKKWKIVAQELGTKTAKQIRERYVNNLSNENKMEKFSLDE